MKTMKPLLLIVVMLMTISLITQSCDKKKNLVDGISTYHVSISAFGTDSISVIIYDTLNNCLAESILPNKDSAVNSFIETAMNPYYIINVRKRITITDGIDVYKVYNVTNYPKYVLDSLLVACQNLRWNEREKAEVFMMKLLKPYQSY